MPLETLSPLEGHAFACLAFGVIGDAMGSPTELLEPDEIERRFGWVERFEGDGTDDVIMRDLLAQALLKTEGYATGDDWAQEWKNDRAMILGDKANRFFPSILHMVEKVVRDYPPQLLAAGTMPSSTSAMAIAPVGIVNAGHPRAAAAQAKEIASLIHVGENIFCQHAAAAVAAATAAALSPGATLESVIAAALDSLRGWSAQEMRALVEDALSLARGAADYKGFRSSYHRRFRRSVICDSRETIPAALAIVLLAEGDPWTAAILSANFGRDTDTIGCMAAGLCGALQGPTPQNQARIESLSAPVRKAQLELARALAALAGSKGKRECAAWRNGL